MYVLSDGKQQFVVYTSFLAHKIIQSNPSFSVSEAKHIVTIQHFNESVSLPLWEAQEATNEVAVERIL